MDFAKLYFFDEADIRGALRVSLGPHIDEVALVKGERLPCKPLVGRHHIGGSAKDVVSTAHPAIKILSDRVIQVLRDGGFTGWTTFPVEIYNKRAERIDGYHRFAVTGRCGPVDWSKGKKVRKPPPVPWGKGYDAWIGMYFDPKTWDGTDVFIPEGMTCTVVVERVMRALTGAKITNAKFKPLTEFERSWPV